MFLATVRVTFSHRQATASTPRHSNPTVRYYCLQGIWHRFVCLWCFFRLCRATPHSHILASLQHHYTRNESGQTARVLAVAGRWCPDKALGQSVGRSLCALVTRRVLASCGVKSPSRLRSTLTALLIWAVMVSAVRALALAAFVYITRFNVDNRVGEI